MSKDKKLVLASSREVFRSEYDQNIVGEFQQQPKSSELLDELQSSTEVISAKILKVMCLVM